MLRRGHELRCHHRRCFTEFLELDHTSRLDQLELAVSLGKLQNIIKLELPGQTPISTKTKLYSIAI